MSFIDNKIMYLAINTGNNFSWLICVGYYPKLIHIQRENDQCSPFSLINLKFYKYYNVERDQLVLKINLIVQLKGQTRKVRTKEITKLCN